MTRTIDKSQVACIMFISQIDANYTVCLSTLVIGDCVKDFCDFSMQIDCVVSNLVFPLHNIGLRSWSPTRIIGYVVTVLFVNHIIYHLLTWFCIGF